MSQVASIEEDAEQLYAEIKQLRQLEENTHTIWKGEASNKFNNKLSQLVYNMQRTYKQMIDLAYTIKYCANRIRNEEEKEKERAAALSNGGGFR